MSMTDKLMTGFWRFIFMIPPFLWEKQAHKMRRKIEKEFDFMTEEHRKVHHGVVKELPGVGEPLSTAFVARRVGLPGEQVKLVLDDLETVKMLVRNDMEEVVWAYPVTVEETPHHLTFSTGERVYAA